jgi:hypothetical protein
MPSRGKKKGKGGDDDTPRVKQAQSNSMVHVDPLSIEREESLEEQRLAESEVEKCLAKAMQGTDAAGGNRGQSASSRYRTLVSDALRIMRDPSVEGSIEVAAKKLITAVGLCPERRDAHGVLAQLGALVDVHSAMVHYLRTLELSVAHDELWAKSAVSVFDYFQFPTAPDGPQHDVPEWWNDAALKAMATTCKEVLPECEWRAVRMHATILGAPVYPRCRWESKCSWGSHPRTPHELRAAAESYSQLNKLVAQARHGLFPMGPEDKYLVELPDTGIKAHIALGLQCRRLAERLENEPPPLE